MFKWGVLLTAFSSFVLFGCSAEEAETKSDEIAIEDLRDSISQGKFINNRKFRRLVEDYSEQLHGTDFRVLMDCHVYFYAVSERSAMIDGVVATGSFEGMGWPKAKKYKYQLSYNALELAVIAAYNDLLKDNRNQMSDGAYQAYRQMEYSPLILRECVWEYEPDDHYDSVVHEWFCKDGYYERKASFDFETYLGNLPQYCRGLAESYLDNGKLSLSEKRFNLVRSSSEP